MGKLSLEKVIAIPIATAIVIGRALLEMARNYSNYQDNRIDLNSGEYEIHRKIFYK